MDALPAIEAGSAEKSEKIMLSEPVDRRKRSINLLRRALEYSWPLQYYLDDIRVLTHSKNEPLTETLDRLAQANVANMTMGLSPSSLFAAYNDWLFHLMMSPGKQLQLAGDLKCDIGDLIKGAQCDSEGSGSEACRALQIKDNRFKHESWQQFPFNVVHQGFLMHQRWWERATTDVQGVSKAHERIMSFTARQLLDMLSPSNYFVSNPEVLTKTYEELGVNLWRGMKNYGEDLARIIQSKKPVGVDEFKVGENLAITPGQVVYRNELMELIQYEAVSEQVHPEPIFIVPAWIMKFYILDLSTHNSLVKFLTEQGFTVFIISWKNPTREDRDVSLDDYRILGIEKSLEAIKAITGQNQVHAAGYCLGGTLLSIAAAAQAREGDETFKSVCLLAAQTDFIEAGEIMLFVDDSQVSLLDSMMWRRGFLEDGQMAGAFQLLRSNDLIWSRIIREYQLGQRSPVNDIMAWNTDSTRMPYKMHSEYLHSLFLENQLARGHFQVQGKPISLTDIRAPIFAVGTESDHVAPWQSVYKIHLLSDTEVSFVLTSGGHNAGIVSEPGHHNRHYRITTRADQAKYIGPERWQQETPEREGSWWLAYSDWLAERSSKKIKPPAVGAAEKGYPVLEPAPGSYVFEH